MADLVIGYIKRPIQFFLASERTGNPLSPPPGPQPAAARSE